MGVGSEERIALVRVARGHTAAPFGGLLMRQPRMGTRRLPFRRFGALHTGLVLFIGANTLLTPAGTAQEWEDIAPLVPAADEQPANWRFTTTKPGEDWFKPALDDSTWAQGPGGFGTTDTPGAVIGTTWNTADIWLRREIEMPAPPWGDVQLWLHHDEDTEVYVNGVLALRIEGWSSGYEAHRLPPTGRAALRPGRNELAVHCHQTSGGQYIDLGLVALVPSPPDPKRWSRDRAWNWFTNQALPMGFNYIPANSISYTEMWMGYTFDPERIDRELALAQEVGFNCARVVLPYVVWEAEPEAFKQRFETFLSICRKRGIRVMPCFFDDCVFGPITDPVFGRQPGVVPGWYANGWTPSPGHQRVRDPEARPALERYVKDVMTAHRDDPRILCWDLYNEPGNSGLGNATLPLLKDTFRWAREINPSQPITSGVWGGSPRVTGFLKAHSDIITFHDYQPAPELHRTIAGLEPLGRPLICTEWLNRPRDSKVETCLPLFVEARVGAVHWGLVNGRTQTDLPWGHKPGKPYTGPWQHDLFRPDHSPYNPQEIGAFRTAIQQTKRPGTVTKPSK